MGRRLPAAVFSITVLRRRSQWGRASPRVVFQNGCPCGLELSVRVLGPSSSGPQGAGPGGPQKQLEGFRRGYTWCPSTSPHGAAELVLNFRQVSSRSCDPGVDRGALLPLRMGVEVNGRCGGEKLAISDQGLSNHSFPLHPPASPGLRRAVTPLPWFLKGPWEAEETLSLLSP
ncbi:specifically androgen-regulated protein [Platysternon megacephalum]|uniref:Specifically androgen-regulated protein n=1 Tax=Platysternon megacephalum TaxID=55544 RepID=A0A4D9E0U9_9SAUR|nr:specifically androgen-regulated protein [Platysternon megacephalum]